MAADLLKVAGVSHNFIFAGDMNFSNLGETDHLYRLGYEDGWLAFRGLEPGYTWDAQENTLIRLTLPLDNRRLRLDRIAWHQKAENVFFRSIEIVCDRPIAGLTKWSYPIFPSDHFGLRSWIRVVPKHANERNPVFDYAGKRELILRGRSPDSTGYWSEKHIAILRVGTLVLFCCLLFGFATFVFKALQRLL